MVTTLLPLTTHTLPSSPAMALRDRRLQRVGQPPEGHRSEGHWSEGYRSVSHPPLHQPPVHQAPLQRSPLGAALKPWPARACGGVLALGLIVAQLLGATPVKAGMLDVVKQNPALARNLCEQFKQLNANGQSATSKESIARVAASQGLSNLDAEVLTTYVIGLHCPDVR